MVLLTLGGIAAFAFLLSHLFVGGRRMVALAWGGGCTLSLALPLLAVALAVRAFRDLATPLADVMTAADAVAGGDLSVRVPERGPGDFRRMAISFNRMAEELERADSRRRNLTADVAHELRTPLQIIQGNLEGILDGVYEPTVERVEATLDETRLLALLVEDLRVLSLAEAGQLPLTLEQVDVAELLNDTLTSFSGQAQAAELDLRIEIEDNLPPITGDVARLEQALGNLMSNALRHTPAGGVITLGARPVDRGIRISVSDSGEGIPAGDLPYVFDRFWRGDRARSRSGGARSGLGLAITRQLIEAHGGTIGVESELGRGTTFTIELQVGESLPSRLLNERIT